jgi:hypothetical protein
MAQFTVKQLSIETGVPLDRLMCQLEEAGIVVLDESSSITDVDKLKLLGYLRARAAEQANIAKEPIRPVSIRLKRRPKDIRDCDFEFKCPRYWEQLQETPDSQIRFCGMCNKNVYLCRTQKDLERFAGEKICVAIDSPRQGKKPMGTIVSPSR